MPVQSVSRHPDHVLVTPRGRDPERFDQVVFATHSDQALSLLADPSDREHEILGSIPYQPNEVVVHTDARMLPRRRRAWASWNYHLLEQPGDRTTVTYHMNRLQSLTTDTELCVTLNRTSEIDPDKVIRTITYEHPVFTREGVRAQRRNQEISGRNRTSYCGAYWGWGFHEDGVDQRGAGGGALRWPTVSASCIYEGTVRHRRSKPANEFTHRLAMVFVDLDELPSLLEGRLQRARPGLLRFRRRDYHGEPERPLADAVRDTVAAHTGSRPRGPGPGPRSAAVARALL